MALPEIVDHETWYARSKALLEEEKELTRRLDALATKRRELPMVRIETDYRFEGPGGEATLAELFGDHRQLIVQHFMFDPEWSEGCGSCSAMAATAATPGILEQLAGRGTAFAAISRAPRGTIEAYRQAKGWTFPWYSSFGTSFNRDFHVTFDPDQGQTPWNFRDADELRSAGHGWLTTYRGEQPGISCFLREGEDIYRTSSRYGRGVEVMMPAYDLLDLTALGRQEPWELPEGRATPLYDNASGILSGDVAAP